MMTKTSKILCLALAAAFCLAAPSCKKSKTATNIVDDYNAAVRKGIKKYIEDKDRKNKLLALQAKGVMQQVDTALIFVAMGAKMRNNPNLTREEAAEMIAESEKQRAIALKALSATKREMRSLVSADEWQKIFVAPTEAQNKGKE